MESPEFKVRGSNSSVLVGDEVTENASITPWPHLVQIKQQHLRRFGRNKLHARLIRKRRGVARFQRVAVELNLAFRHMQPGVASRLQRVRDFIPSFEPGNIKI